MDAMTFVLFGSTGDLAKRKIFPAMYNLFLEQKLPKSFSVVALGRKPFTDAEFQDYVERSLHTFSRRKPEDRSHVEPFLRCFRYFALDVMNQEGYRELLKRVQEREKELDIPENRLFYLSVAPEFFDKIASHIKESGLGAGRGWKRLIIEKPFGHDLASARKLNDNLSLAFEEDEIYRIDHYLGKPMVQNLETLVSANPLLKALWSNQYIANIQITASETVGVEERAGYYEGAGAIRDMFQNHMLQLMMMTAMHLPTPITEQNTRNQKINLLKSLRSVSKEDAAHHVIRGQYGAGEMQNQVVAAYRNEPGVDASSMTDTFVAARLWIDDFFWKDVPIYIRTGKRMKEKSTRIVIEFKDRLREQDGNMNPFPNLLTIQINPDEKITLQLNGRNPLKNGQMEPVTMDFSMPADQLPEAYELLLFDALRGDATFFAHWEEVELAWAWVQPVLEAFEENLLPLHSYPAGSYGPAAASALLDEEGFHWWHDGQAEAPGTRGLPELVTTK
ncbi:MULTISPECIES: glucose-6-phosphate dehydrogenase [unclassified Paenibacillus]|uniref:glucose-6-phosphate dehydrogenase n=1 Tax=unclassified Paenibacillus TaxID=185978 RepID=UPI001AEA93AE|nr:MULTISPECIES: glucose-6-phosphate dehydrogenase [unclassified Paenibacillus]MBP1154314.1 glucose-6-phosphate 1-dehydrogenase [Paenibacillus sp. PvP091]MBP1170302.1 glucose-6-phosphate 1-dehydrogenase [Paenibacillus sp. PvR098]MBP2441330.1 glucose-6-phosphate 1-dehydrogenase [Paenibacillus sp. PvP052]